MSGAAVSRESNTIQDLLLIILRFTITLEETDRAAVLAMAENMDRLGARTAPSDFAFFARTSGEICDLIVGKAGPQNIATLRRRLREIDNERLQRALEAALEIEPAAPKIGKNTRPRWRGSLARSPNQTVSASKNVRF